MIVYAPTIKRVEDTIEYLEEMENAAIPYHAKLEAATQQMTREQ